MLEAGRLLRDPQPGEVAAPPRTLNPYPTALDQAWLRWWVERYGPDSKLACYLLPEAPHEYRPVPHDAGQGAASNQNGKQFGRHARPPEVEKAPPQRSRKEPGLGHNKSARRREKKADAEARRMAPLSDWAKRLIGDERISDTTLDDVIDGIEDYFVTFERLRKVDKSAWIHFSRVGAPLLLRNMYMWTGHTDAPILNGGAFLPSYFGGFVPKTKEEYRKLILGDKGHLAEFFYFSKVKNPATAAPPGTTIYTQTEIYLGRDAFDKAERQRFPWATDNFGIWYYIGILPNGMVRALPMRMNNVQHLPRGGSIHTSRFQIPPGLYDRTINDREVDPHTYAHHVFSSLLAFTASAVSGIHVTIRKGKRSARIGLPIGAIKNFFADRDPGEGQRRRKPILHLRLGHDRYLHDGRIVTVGEHLAGERRFDWRGYEISIGAPGIHFPSPEGFKGDVWETGPGTEPIPPDEELKPIGYIGKKLEDFTFRRPRRVRFHHGEPDHVYAHSVVDERPVPPDEVEEGEDDEADI
jgi:hypothetical protein